MAARGGGSFWAELTPSEASFVRKCRAIEVLFKAGVVTMWASWQQSYIDLFNGDSGAMAVHCENTGHQSAALPAGPDARPTCC